jgi:glutaconyl-CoA/methylmalonyl-CoA decarboxylase subunit gamma
LSTKYTRYSMKKYLITVNDKQYEVEVAEVRSSAQAQKTIESAPKMKKAVSTDHIKSKKAVNGGKSVSAPMPGSILKVNVAEGDVVTKGQSLLVFEAMKMENDLTAPCDGTVAQVNVKQGGVMAVGDVLIVIE